MIMSWFQLDTKIASLIVIKVAKWIKRNNSAKNVNIFDKIFYYSFDWEHWLSSSFHIHILPEHNFMKRCNLGRDILCYKNIGELEFLV